MAIVFQNIVIDEQAQRANQLTVLASLKASSTRHPTSRNLTPFMMLLSLALTVVACGLATGKSAQLPNTVKSLI